MSAAIDRYDISLIDAFLRDQLDAETSESFELRMLGDADFAVVVAQRRAMIDAVDRAVRPATSSRRPEGDGERDQGAIEALLAWFTGPAWSGVATAGFALCAALLVFEPAGLASLSAAAPPRAQTFAHEVVLHSLRSTSSASVPAAEPFLLVVEAIDAQGVVSARLAGPEVVDLSPVVVGDDGFVRIMVDRLAAGSYDIELHDSAGQSLIAYAFEVSSQD